MDDLEWLRHRLLRYPVERHGFDAYAFESGFTEGWSVDTWVRGGDDPIGQVMANNITSLMGRWKPMRAQLEWMAGHNRAATRAVSFYGLVNPSADFFAGQLFTDMEAPEPGSLDALMTAGHDGLFATDLRRLSPSGAVAVGTATRQRYGTYYSDPSPLDAYDAIVHIPRVTPADPDVDALAHAPREVQDAFSRWKSKSQ